MNVFAKIADGLAGWLTYEQWCERQPLFCESYLALPLAELLQGQYPGRVLSEVVHPVLVQHKEGRGAYPRIDFAVTGQDDTKYELTIETKWVSESPTLLRDIIRDIVRLDLLLPTYAKEAIIVLAGNKRDTRRFFEHPLLQAPKPDTAVYKHLLTPDGHNRSTIYFFHAITPPIRQILLNVLEAFEGVEVSRVIQIERSGPFPRSTTTKQYEVYVWKVKPCGKKFKAEDYKILSQEVLT